MKNEYAAAPRHDDLRSADVRVVRQHSLSSSRSPCPLNAPPSPASRASRLIAARTIRKPFSPFERLGRTGVWGRSPHRGRPSTSGRNFGIVAAFFERAFRRVRVFHSLFENV